MKKRKTKNYIVIGTAHLGMDLSVLQTIKTTADHYDADVIHVGPLATRTEMDMWRRREKKLRAWEDSKAATAARTHEKISDKLADLEEKILELEDQADQVDSDDKYNKIYERIEDLRVKSGVIEMEYTLSNAKLGEDHERHVSERDELEKIQWSRIQSIMDIFGKKVKFVCNDELHIPNLPEEAESYLGIKQKTEIVISGEDIDIERRIPVSVEKGLKSSYVDRHLRLGEHLFVTAVPANGDKMAGSPITPRTFRMLKQMGHSHIVPHMTTHVKPFARPGLNQAFNFWTTGAVQICDHPKKITDAYKSSARTGCVLVSIDKDNGEFHAQRLMVKLFWGRKNHKQIPHIIHDGMVFSMNSAIESKTEDKAMHATDMHGPHDHPGVVAASRAANVMHKPSVYIDGGDTADFESISHHIKHKLGTREGMRLINDLNALKRVLDSMANKEEFPWIKERVLLDSNHGEWLTHFVDENPNLIGICDWKTIAESMLADWNVFIRSGGEDKFYLFGDLHIKHADKEGSISTANSVYGNYLGGHHHSFQEIGDAMFAGPGCKLGPKYLQNRATSWQNQFTTITKFKGRTCKHPKTVFHNEESEVSRFAYRGQIWEVPYYK